MMKDFGDFLVIGIQVLLRKTDSNLRIFRTLQSLYKEIILDKTKKETINKYLLDFETKIDMIPSDKQIITITSNKEDRYCFSLNEVMECFHADLSRHNIEVNEEYNISSLIKNYRQPYHPYCNRPFDKNEIRQIICGIAYHKISYNYIIYPEIYIFFRYFEFILNAIKNKSVYDTTYWLDEFFTKNNLYFEKIENGSYQWLSIESYTFKNFLYKSFFPLYSINNNIL